MVLAPPSRYHSAWGAGGWWPGVVGGRVAFRKYDNDSDARRRGTYELTCSPMRGGCGCDAPWWPCDADIVFPSKSTKVGVEAAQLLVC